MSVSERIIQTAIDRQASDVHLQRIPQGVLVRFRCDGVLEDFELLSDEIGGRIINHIKVIGNMDIADTRRPQDGRLFYPYADRNVDLRLASLSTLHGENLTLRILDRQPSLRTLDTLGLEERELGRVERLLRSPRGLVLVTGPTGAGKTTTLYAILESLKSPQKNIITVEEPIEYDLQGINQVAINRALRLGFAECLRACFRHDPDILMIGEIRDRESARIAVRAALSGHLVFSTLHTGSSLVAFKNMVQFGVPPYLLGTALVGVITQQLLRRVCPDCRESHELEPGLLASAARHELDEVLAAAGNPPLVRGRGCSACRGLGYQGRAGIFEILGITPYLRDALVLGASLEELELRARETGWRCLLHAGFCRVARGESTIEELLRVIPLESERREQQSPAQSRVPTVEV